jgi:hypothetical protein
MPVDYSKGKIYQIVDYTNDNVYIGSTCEPTLARRLANHVISYKAYLNGKAKYVTSYKIIENDNYDIQLIELYPCETKDELHKREGHFIKNTANCVNIKIECRTKAEYREDNKDKIKQYREDNKDKIKQYREDNKDKIKQYYEDNKDTFKQYREQNKELYDEYQKKYREDNKDKINEHQKQKIICVCGSETIVSHKARHEQTKKHKAFIEKQNDE